MATLRKIKICTWNSDSIKLRKLEFEQFLINFEVDVCCLNETKLASNQKFHCNNYVIYRNDRNAHGGGVAILIKNNIKHCVLPSLPNISQEHVIVNIYSKSGTFSIIAIYNPPKKSLNMKDLQKLCNVNKRVLILGDLNAKHLSWNCPVNNKNGNVLLKFITKNNILMLTPDEPTFYPTYSLARPSVIDIALAKNISNFTKPISLSQLSTNHNPVYLEYDGDAQLNKSKTVYDFKITNIVNFKNALVTRLLILTLK